MAGPEQFGRLNIFAVIKNLLNNRIAWFTGNGVPVDGTTFAGKAGPGSTYFDLLTGQRYNNVGTLASPVWVAEGGLVVGIGGLGATGNAKMTYDFTVDGGAISTITPTNSPLIPANAIILGGTIDCTVSANGGAGATIALGLGSGAQVAALKGATAFATFAAPGQVALVPVFTAATFVKVAAATRLTVTIATNTLTAGRFDVNIVYVQGNA